MAQTTILTPSQELDEKLRLILRQLKERLSATTSAGVYDMTDIQQDQIDRTKDVIWQGIGDWPEHQIIDPDWVSRFNEAIERGDQELAAKVLVGKEDRIDLAWDPSINPTIIKYKIYYTENVEGDIYNGTTLSLGINQSEQPSPLEVPLESIIAPSTPAVKLYGSVHGIPYKFAVSEVLSDGSEGGISPIFKAVSLLWKKPRGKNIKRYEIHYKTQEKSDTYDANIFRQVASTTVATLSSPIVIEDESLLLATTPTVKYYTNVMNVPFFVKVVALTDTDESLEIVEDVFITSNALPCKNEYCEIEIQKDDDIFGIKDRISSLLWYINYVFFLREKNFWAAHCMINERKKKKTVFPTSTPWYFTPTLKGAWEQVPYSDEDQYISYVEQAINIPLIVLNLNLKKVMGGTLHINNTLINETVAITITPNGLSYDVSLSVGNLKEKYTQVRTVSDLATVMASSQIGIVVPSSNSSNLPFMGSATQTYRQAVLKFSRAQIETFSLAYYGDFIAKPFGFLLDFGPERRITLEGWENDFSTWQGIHNDLSTFLGDLLLLNPLYYINDISAQIMKRLRDDVVDIPELESHGMLPEKDMERILAMLKEDDGLTRDFTEYMDSIMDSVTNEPLRPKEVTRTKTEIEEVFTRREEVLMSKEKPESLQAIRLPAGWSLQQMSAFKLKNADYWTRVADFNMIANPLDSVEIYDGRIIVLPKMPGERVRNPHQA